MDIRATIKTNVSLHDILRYREYYSKEVLFEVDEPCKLYELAPVIISDHNNGKFKGYRDPRVQIYSFTQENVVGDSVALARLEEINDQIRFYIPLMNLLLGNDVATVDRGLAVYEGPTFSESRVRFIYPENGQNASGGPKIKVVGVGKNGFDAVEVKKLLQPFVSEESLDKAVRDVVKQISPQ